VLEHFLVGVTSTSVTSFSTPARAKFFEPVGRDEHQSQKSSVCRPFSQGQAEPDAGVTDGRSDLHNMLGSDRFSEQPENASVFLRHEHVACALVLANLLQYVQDFLSDSSLGSVSALNIPLSPVRLRELCAFSPPALNTAASTPIKTGIFIGSVVIACCIRSLLFCA
jgi:hypothetical protein